MKYKLIGIVMALIMFFCALAAAAFEAGEGPHRVHQHLAARQPYAVCDCDGTELCTHLPLVVINTNGQEIPGEVTENYDKYGETIYNRQSEQEQPPLR